MGYTIQVRKGKKTAIFGKMTFGTKKEIEYALKKVREANKERIRKEKLKLTIRKF